MRHERAEIRREVGIVGGGVAGCTLALALHRMGHSVAVLERCGSRPMRVGEHLNPNAKPLLAGLDLWRGFVADGHLPCRGIRSSWGKAELSDLDYFFNAYGTGWNLDRQRFEMTLENEVRSAGIDFFCGAHINSLDKTGCCWSVSATTAESAVSLEFDVVADATGRAAAIARRLRSQLQVVDNLTAVVRWLYSPAATASEGNEVLVEAMPDGWWYSAPLPGGRFVAAFMTDRDLARSAALSSDRYWSERLACSHHTAERLAKAGSQGPVCVRPAHSVRLDPPVGDCWIAVGDAAAAFDPLSSMGLARALQWGTVAAGAIDRYLLGDKPAFAAYATALASEFRAYMAGRAAYYIMEQRWPDHPFWRRRRAGLGADHSEIRVNLLPESGAFRP